MCGRFALTQTDEQKLTETFSLGGALPDLAPRYNIAPTQTVATVVRDADSGENRLALMRWGLIPSWSKDPSAASKMINARGETVHEKPSFRTALRRRRCLIIADGFYEWQANADGPKQPMFISLKDRQLFGMAGLYEFWSEPESGEKWITCAIVTTEANELMAQFHHRMPVILPRADYAAWLNLDYADPAQVMPMIAAYPADQMIYYPVSRRVNHVANDDPGLIERAG
jgi:putative SOS response-associated peptidase YedK